RVIDVECACIVPCPPDAPYIALSYQWGTDQKVKLRKEYISIMTTPGFFNTAEGQPAQTIRDAMTMVQQLGYRFAWVDALCIVQDDIENVIENVDRMNQVYQGAHLTFVAAAGQNAYHGLPGVSTPRKERQLRVHIKGITISSMLENAHGAISFTRWNTRGWTYQERLLSKRLVIFTASQVFYQCDRGCGFQEQYQYTPGSDFTHTLPDPLTRLDFENRNIWEVYAIAVAEYTRRSLTDPMDKLRALGGILNCLEQPFGAPFFFGLPSTLFDVGLLWKPLGPCSRDSSAFPSWSWAGWDGAVVYE
ncbi:HET-domain-containing protein, partial [Cenococcum geophilum 1.58]|uniref:HET-domain-containing protein n=1 Tax=Cenococcum geophilum 1.58 TaxID=794803 RepID=UPI00358EA766